MSEKAASHRLHVLLTALQARKCVMVTSRWQMIKSPCGLQLQRVRRHVQAPPSQYKICSHHQSTSKACVEDQQNFMVQGRCSRQQHGGNPSIFAVWASHDLQWRLETACPISALLPGHPCVTGGSLDQRSQLRCKGSGYQQAPLKAQQPAGAASSVQGQDEDRMFGTPISARKGNSPC